jgi:hypothetical protein
MPPAPPSSLPSQQGSATGHLNVGQLKTRSRICAISIFYSGDAEAKRDLGSPGSVMRNGRAVIVPRSGMGTDTSPGNHPGLVKVSTRRRRMWRAKC